ncbi:tyrosine-protein kinase ABL1-like [Amphiura filiformis]|uniref:tyrosine-protein kinase ABL1-like n=1 Tax=Amphiura filiformis TaxID=82378 RepID=UPI003B20F5AE
MSTYVNHVKRSDLKYVKELGEGGYGSVYQMTWKRPQGRIEIAAKKLRKRDVHELEVMSGLDHPNIVKLLGVVDEEMEFMLILELCEGGSLRSYLDNLQGKQLSDKHFLDWAEQAARPLEYLRQKQIIHKDVKSPNYMITAENNLKLGDFGLAKNAADTVGNATERATHRWMAPELLEKGILSPKYDIFAFAVVLWEMRTGKVPFEGLEWQVIVLKVISKKERLPIPEDCPQAIQDLMKQCWEEDWRKRPAIEEVIKVITTAAAVSTDSSMLFKQQKFIVGSWKLERQFGHQDNHGTLSSGWSIVVNSSNRDIAVADHFTSQVIVYTGNGKYKFSMDNTCTHGLPDPGEKSKPWQVVVNPQGTTYFVTLLKHIKCYDAMGKFKCQWMSSCPEAVPGSSCLYGLAMDHDGYLLVGDCKNKRINMHKNGGTYISSIKIGVSPRYIAVTSEDTIVVVGDWEEQPQIVSKAGQVMHTLKHPFDESEWDPSGVFCYEDIIIIANRSTSSMLCYSEFGKYMGDIPISNTDPVGVAISEDGKELLVSDFAGSVKVFTL